MWWSVVGGSGPDKIDHFMGLFSGPFPGGVCVCVCVRSASGQPSTKSSATLLNEEHEHWVGSGRRFPRNYNSEDPGGTGKGSGYYPSVAISRGSSGHSADMVGGIPFNHIYEKGVPRPGRRNKTDTMPRTPFEIPLQSKSPVAARAVSPGGLAHRDPIYTGIPT